MVRDAEVSVIVCWTFVPKSSKTNVCCSPGLAGKEAGVQDPERSGIACVHQVDAVDPQES